MFRTLNDFYEGWKYESEATLKVLSFLTDQSLTQKVTEGGRSLGFIAWHITKTIGEMMSKTGLAFPDFNEEASVPARAISIKEEYEKLSNLMIEQIKEKWSDEMLNDELNMYGQPWKRSSVLDSLVAHQNHHRGQMTVLMRQAGLKVPGIYGPSKEEWETYGMPVQE
ncbi:MAG: hypothetical protein KF816_16580 [Melioribacteraceae bacterium]|nr:hypothetical protein [Melioribacteraceae bacterium]